MSVELRCDQGKLFGILVEGELEVRCQSQFCGHKAGLVVIHRFSLETGEMLGTRRYRKPPSSDQKGSIHADSRSVSSLRPS